MTGILFCIGAIAVLWLAFKAIMSWSCRNRIKVGRRGSMFPSKVNPADLINWGTDDHSGPNHGAKP